MNKVSPHANCAVCGKAFKVVAKGVKGKSYHFACLKAIVAAKVAP